MEKKKSPNDEMVDALRLKAYLIDSGRLTEDQILRAEDYALTRKISLENTLLFLRLLSHTELGEDLGKIYGKPYHPLLTEPPPDSAKEMVSLKYAERWKIFPVEYNPKKNILTLAVSNPEDPGFVGQIQTLFSAPLQLAFTVASIVEINKAIDVHYKGKIYIPDRILEVPHDFAILVADHETEQELTPEEEIRTKRKILLLEPDLNRANSLRNILRREGYRDVNWILTPEDIDRALKEEFPDLLLVNGRVFRRQGSWLKSIPDEVELPHISYYNLTPLLLGQEHPYQQMGEALISLTAFLVRKSLMDDQGQLHEILTRVRYCKLLALRLNLYPGQVDGTVLAAWLSVQGLEKDLLEHIVTPYSLDEIINPATNVNDVEKIETIILSIVKEYQTLRMGEPGISRDINRVRSLLSQQFSSHDREATLEAFLNLVKDEEFLKKVDQLAGLVLIVDATQSQNSSMALRLSNDGYEVETVSDVSKALDVIAMSRVDLIISEVNLPGIEGMSFCRTIKENSVTAHIPFFFLTAEEGERLATICLEAGADDFLKKPVDLELLSLKIQRILAMKAPQKSKRGVSGSLSEMNSTDFIQSLSEGQKGVEIILESNSLKGSIYMQKGEIIHAGIGKIKGEEAFYRTMTWEEGEFQIIPCSNFPNRTIHQSTMSLLMEAARLADEAEGAIDEED